MSLGVSGKLCFVNVAFPGNVIYTLYVQTDKEQFDMFYTTYSNMSVEILRLLWRKNVHNTG